MKGGFLAASTSIKLLLVNLDSVVVISYTRICRRLNIAMKTCTTGAMLSEPRPDQRTEVMCC